MNGKRKQRNDRQSADRHQIDNREARKKKRNMNVEVYCVVPCSQFCLVSFREYKLKVGEREVTLKSDRVPVTRYTKREGGHPQVRQGSCHEIHKERGRSPSSQTGFLSRDTQRERGVTLKSDRVPVTRYTKREGGHPQVRQGSCHEIHKERGGSPSSQTGFLSRDTPRERDVTLKSDRVPVTRYTKREGGHPQVRQGSCHEIHKERGGSPSSQTGFLSRDTQREREVTLKSDRVPVKRYTKREGGHPQVRQGSSQEIHKERGRSPSSQTWFQSRDTQREREVTLKSDRVPVKRYTEREGGHPQVRHGSCHEIHKERGRSPSSQTGFLSRDTQRERGVTLKSDRVPVTRYTKREGRHPQVRQGSCHEIHKERGGSPSSQTGFLSRDTQRERVVTLKSDRVPVTRYTEREGGHPQVRQGSCHETHKERGRSPSRQTGFLSRDTQRKYTVSNEELLEGLKH